MYISFHLFLSSSCQKSISYYLDEIILIVLSVTGYEGGKYVENKRGI